MLAAGFATFCGLVGMAVDVGHVVYMRTELQKTADAAAFAAAQNLPATADATSEANDYVDLNTTGATADVSFGYSGNSANSVTVKAERHVSYTFLRLVGLDGLDVSAKATVRVGTYSGGSGLLPWGLIASNNNNSTLLQNACYQGLASNGNPIFKQNQQCVLKYGAGSNSGGDFGSLSLGGSGASTYRDNIKYGSTETYKRGDKVNPETGNMVGPTKQGIQDRFGVAPPAGCPGNARNDVLIDNPDGSVSVRPGCESSARIVIIPVVDKIQNPQDSTILGFAFMYLTGYSNAGGSSQVTGEFVEFVTDLPGAVYDGSGEGATAMQLIE